MWSMDKRARRKPKYFEAGSGGKRPHENEKDSKQQNKTKPSPEDVKFVPPRRIIPREDLLVWGKCRGFGWWPGRIANTGELSGPIDPPDDPTRWIKWFGDEKFTETKVDDMAYLHDFNAYFKEKSYNRNRSYNLAVDLAIKEAAYRSGKTLKSNASGITWAKEKFYPEGYLSILPKGYTDDQKRNMKGVKQSESNSSPEKKVKTTISKVEINCQDFTKQRSEVLIKVMEGLLNIENICLGCGNLEVTTQHPMFVGGLCQMCEVDYRESCFLLDDSGYSCYCCVCGGGKRIFLCDNQSCCRSFCFICLELMMGEGTAKIVLHQSPWSCYLCVTSEGRLLQRRDNWHERLSKFVSVGEVEYEIVSLPKSPPTWERKPIRVLSLFDGIATGFVSLKQLGIKVEVYFASEIDHEAICVSEIRHPRIVKHVGDVCEITDKMLSDWGPFDLVIGGSPCNDLSIVNPARKGIWSDKGSGHLFFEYLRILNTCKVLAAKEGRSLFWLFENVVCMDQSSRQTISHYLQRNPIVLDAKNVSPAHRPRCFWGNLPGMRRPMVPTKAHKLTLAECLEPGRRATTDKLRTITTKLQSVRGGHGGGGLTSNSLVIQQRDQHDCLWITEIERVFGFPDHYTDVCNLPRTGRLRILGKSWSVPVIKHIFAPLKDYFSSV
ncbi:DNA (cytosine-5)-methyltransferase 3A-like [Ciona intestinalis]